MRQYKFAMTLLAAAVLASCGGGGNGNQTSKIRFSSMVSFGDAFSDVGSYKVGTVAALGGGQFNINGSGSGALTGKNWTELMAAQLGLAAPCAAQTGLNGVAALGFSVPVVNHAGCTSYAQGGARVSGAVGPGNQTALGALTVPVAIQIQNHLAANGGAFKGDEIVFVVAGSSDISAQLAGLTKAATDAGNAAGALEGAKVGGATFASTLIPSLAAGATTPATAAQAIGKALQDESVRPGSDSNSVATAAVTAAATQPGNAAVGNPAVWGPLVVAARTAATTAGTAAGKIAGAKAEADYVTANAPLIVLEMGRLGAELANMLKNQVVGKGAKYVTVVNIPDALAASAAQRDLIRLMITTFNEQLRLNVASEPKILYSDSFTANVDQIANPDLHGLTNVKSPACDLSPAKNPLASSLLCNAANLNAGDVSHYLFSDGQRPTPFGYLLLARFVSKDMVIKGWL